MPQDHASTGFARGFFGCFGILAAIALVVCGLFAWHVVSLFNKGVRADDLVAKQAGGVVLQDGPEAACRMAVASAANTYRTAGPPTLVGWPDIHSVAKDGQVQCRANDRKGAIVVYVSLLCDVGGDAACLKIDGVTRGKRALRLR